MSSALPSALAVLSAVASLAVAAAAHRQLRWMSPWAPPLPPTTTMPSALLSLPPWPRTKTGTLARWWCLKARASVHLRAVPAILLKPPRCCHRAAAIALCAAAAFRAAATAADAATAATPPPSCRQRCAVAPSPSPQHPHCIFLDLTWRISYMLGSAICLSLWRRFVRSGWQHNSLSVLTLATSI